MAQLFSTKYPNNSREVSGTVTIYRDDVVLLCDTSSAPVVINLFDIPNGFWSTQWKLYIVDNSDNASSNSITINAGTGQEINDSSSLVLNTDGSSALVRIVSDDKFLANLTTVTGGSGGGYDTIQDEGVSLTQRTTMDFVGEYVEATDTGSKTQVEVNPIVKQITNANFLSAISGGTLVSGLMYEITDPLYAESVFINALGDNIESLSAQATFLFADYNSVGDYSGVSGFSSQLGRWHGGLSVVVGSVVIWDNKHYVNLTGAIGTEPNADAVNWSVLSKSITNGYIDETCNILYNSSTNLPIVVNDLRGNEVWYNNNSNVTITQFPFGDNNIKNNVIKGDTSEIDNLCNVPFLRFDNNNCLNSVIEFSFDYQQSIAIELSCYDNFINGDASLSFSITQSISGIGVEIAKNNLQSGNISLSNILASFSSVVKVENNLCQGGQCFIGTTSIDGNNNVIVSGNTFHDECRMTVQIIDSTSNTIDIKNNVLSQASAVTFDISGLADFIGNRIDEAQGITEDFTDNDLQGGRYSILSKEQSTFRKVLDLSDSGVFNLGTLFLGAESWIGEYLLTNVDGQTISKINGGTISERPNTIINYQQLGATGLNLTFTSIATAVADDLIDNGSINGRTTLLSYTNYNDRSTFIRGGGATGFNFLRDQMVSA